MIAQVRPVETVTVNQDTTPKKSGEKIETTPKTADTAKNDNSNAYQLFGYNDQKMDSLWREYKKHSAFINGYYKTDTYKELYRKLYGDESDKFYDNDTLKYLMTSLTKISDHIKKNYGVADGKLKDRNDELTNLGIKIGAYYSSNDFKALNQQLQQKYAIAPDKDYSISQDADYKKYQAELKNKIPAEIGQETNRVEDIRLQMEREYASVDFTGSIKRIHELSDSLKLYYTKDHVKQHEYADAKSTIDALPAAERQMYVDQIMAYSNNPEYKRENELLGEAIKRINAYMHTPDFLQHEQEWQNHLKTVMGSDYEAITNPEKRVGK